MSSSLFGSRYGYGPVSALYFFGRHQDLAVQKARSDVNLRNHMRLWRAPVNLNGTPVWVGQASRDIGVRLTTKTITTHKIDPDVDSARWYLMQDMFYSQTLIRFAFAKGGGRGGARESACELYGRSLLDRRFASGDVALEPARQLPEGGIGAMGTSAAVITVGSRVAKHEVLMRGCFRLQIEIPTKVPPVNCRLSNASVARRQYSRARPW